MRAARHVLICLHWQPWPAPPPPNTPDNSLESYIRLHYTKQEQLIPMRDGVKLFTSIYVPRDTTPQISAADEADAVFGRALRRRQIPDFAGPERTLREERATSSSIKTSADDSCRKASSSKSRRTGPTKRSKTDIDESSDTYDTIEWLLKNVPGNNGRVGMYGISYPGFYCSAGMIDAHPALKAVSPQAPVGDWFFDDFLHNGAFFLAHAYRWIGMNATERPKPTSETPPPLVYPTPDGYKLFLEAGNMEDVTKKLLKDTAPFWNDMMAHPNRDDFWKERDILPHLKNVAPAVMVVGGWYDAEDLYGTFKTYQSIEKRNPKRQQCARRRALAPRRLGFDRRRKARAQHRSAQRRPSFTAAKIEFPFFEKYLKDEPLSRRPKRRSSRRAPTPGERSTPGRRENVEAASCISRENGGLGRSRPPTTDGKSRRIRQRSGQARARTPKRSRRE